MCQYENHLRHINRSGALLDKELFNKQLTKKINNKFDLNTTSVNFDIGNNVDYDSLNEKMKEKESEMNMDIIPNNIETVYEQTSEDLDIFGDDDDE